MLKRAHEANEEEETIKIYLRKEEIEEELIKYNWYHYQKVFNTLIYNDKIHNQLQDDKIRDEILKSILSRE